MPVLSTQAEPRLPLRFLDLATEIRFMIYNATTEERKLPIGLIASCHTIHDEIMPIIAEKTKKLEFTENPPFFNSSSDFPPLTLILPHVEEVTLRAEFVQNLSTKELPSLKVLRITEILPVFQNMHVKMLCHVHIDAYALSLDTSKALKLWPENNLASFIIENTGTKKAEFKKQLKLSDNNRGFKVLFHTSFSTSNLLTNMNDKATSAKQQLDVVMDYDKEEIVERTFSETPYQKNYLASGDNKHLLPTKQLVLQFATRRVVRM